MVSEKDAHNKCTTDTTERKNEQFRLPETALIKRDLCTMKLTSMLQARLRNFSNGVFADVTEPVCEPVSFDYIFWLGLQRLLSRHVELRAGQECPPRVKTRRS